MTYPYPQQQQAAANGFPPGMDAATLAALQQQWAAQNAVYPPQHPSAVQPQDVPPAATPSAAAALGAIPVPGLDQPTAAQAPAKGRTIGSVFAGAVLLSAAAGTAVLVGKLVDRLFRAIDARGELVDQDQLDHPHA